MSQKKQADKKKTPQLVFINRINKPDTKILDLVLEL